MSFNNSLGFNSYGDFTNANHVYNNCNIHKNVLATQRTVKMRTILDDYTRVKPGDMRIEENVCTTSVRLEYRDDEEGRKQYRLWRGVDARRNIGIARLRGREDKFLCVTYDGPDALKAFKQDFDQFAHFRNANIAQIFGYNDNERGLPALVFYDALIPLSPIILDGYRLLPLLSSYFSHQLGRMQRELSVGNLLLCQLWVDPRTSALQKGPYLEIPSMQSWIMFGTSENTIPNTHSAHLPIQTYSNNDAVFEYLTRTCPARTILTGIRFASSGFFRPLVNEQVIPMLSYLPGAIYNRHSGDIIARLPGARERCHYGFRRVLGSIPDGMRESQVVMDDGSVRFTVTSTDLQGIELRYAVDPEEEWVILTESWLAQAHSVLSQLGIHKDDCEDYGILGDFFVHLERTSPHQGPNIARNVYLFIRPVPRPSDDEAIWGSWLEGEKYFWSFDPLGREMAPELEQVHLGLPSFTFRIDSWDTSWSLGHYDAVQKLHVSEGFDPNTAAFALSLGHPILEVVGDESQFEALEELGSHTLPAGDTPRGKHSSQVPGVEEPRMVDVKASGSGSIPTIQDDTREVEDSGKEETPTCSGRELEDENTAESTATDHWGGERNLDVPGSYPTSTSDSVGAFGFYHERLTERSLFLLLGVLMGVLFTRSV